MLIEQLESETGIRKERLMQYAESASRRYYSFTIKKRNGDKRWIRHPSRPLKSLQRWLNARVIRGWKVHNAATAYEPGSSIRNNASRHSHTRFTVRIDFEDFFPSFTRRGIAKFVRDNENEGMSMSRSDIDFFTKLVTRDDVLTIGAPTSPLLTNAIMYEFDREVSRYCERRGLVYSRYADDIFVSSAEPGKLEHVVKFVGEAAKRFPYAKLRINHQKTAYLSRKYRRQITGLVITPDQRISIGRARKREIHALVHRSTFEGLETETHLYLKGLLAFANDVEESFFKSIVRKYGQKVVDRILKD